MLRTRVLLAVVFFQRGNGDYYLLLLLLLLLLHTFITVSNKFYHYHNFEDSYPIKMTKILLDLFTVNNYDTPNYEASSIPQFQISYVMRKPY